MFCQFLFALLLSVFIYGQVNPAPAEVPSLPGVNGMMNKSLATASASAKAAQVTAKEIVQDLFNWTNQVGLLTKQLVDYVIDSTVDNGTPLINYNPAISAGGVLV